MVLIRIGVRIVEFHRQSLVRLSSNLRSPGKASLAHENNALPLECVRFRQSEKKLTAL